MPYSADRWGQYEGSWPSLSFRPGIKQNIWVWCMGRIYNGKGHNLAHACLDYIKLGQHSGTLRRMACGVRLTPMSSLLLVTKKPSLGQWVIPRYINLIFWSLSLKCFPEPNLELHCKADGGWNDPTKSPSRSVWRWPRKGGFKTREFWWQYLLWKISPGWPAYIFL